MSQSPIFVKTYDLLQWLLVKITKFPREHRFGLARHLQEVAFEFQAHLIEAASLPTQNRRGKLEKLRQADVALTKLRLYLRLCRDLVILDAAPHHHVSQMVAEVGRLLGGWFKSLGGATQLQAAGIS